jgi:DNA-binding transcriptional LysR family regulator
VEYFRWHEVPGVEAFQPRWIDFGLGIATSAHVASRGVGVTALPVAAIDHFVSDGRLSVIDVPQEFRPWRLAAVRKRTSNPIVVEPAIECARRAAAEFEATGNHAQYFEAIHE